MLREKIQAAKFVVTCTRHNKDYLAEVGGGAAGNKIVVSYHGVDLDRFKPVPRRDDGTFRILTAGTLRECKGLPDLIEACRLLTARGINCDCTIVGDGPDRRSLEKQIGRAGLDESHEDHGLPESGRPHPALPASQRRGRCPRCPRRISASRTSCSRPWPSRHP